MARIVSTAIPQIRPSDLQAAAQPKVSTVTRGAPHSAFHAQCGISGPPWTAGIHSSLLDKLRHDTDVQDKLFVPTSLVNMFLKTRAMWELLVRYIFLSPRFADGETELLRD